MKAVQWVAPHTMRMVDIPKPLPLPHEALIRIESTGICGSDMHYFEEGRIGRTVLTEPLILGHEYAGIVEAVGSEADPSLVGKRVAVEPGIPCLRCEFCQKGHYNVCPTLTFPGMPPNNGAFAEYIAVHAAFCFPVPEEVSAAEAAMIEPLAVALHAVELARIIPGETVAILGLGPIGLLTAQCARLAGAGTIYGTDLLNYRVEASLKYGVDTGFNAGLHDTVTTIKELTRGRGVDVAIDCARSTETPGIACHVMRPAGRGVMVGISGEQNGVIPVDIARRKELTLTWCRRFLFNFPTAITLVAQKRIDVSSVITHNLPLEKTCEGFEIVSKASENVLKVSIDQD
ncbi:MAG: sorbitol dehydrogenase [Candidatus Hydrogenedentota bacterium]